MTRNHFNTSFYANKSGRGNVEHDRAVLRLYDMALNHGWKAVGTPNNEIQIPEFDPEKGRIIGWPMDVFVMRWNPKVDGGFEFLDIECDGESHGKRAHKDEHRDGIVKFWAGMFPGLRVVRIDKESALKASEDYIMKELGL